VLVAAVAAVIGEIVVDVAGDTFGIVVPVETAEFFMFERGRQPGLLRMALAAVALDLQVQSVLWSERWRKARSGLPAGTQANQVTGKTDASFRDSPPPKTSVDSAPAALSGPEPPRWRE
jgi:hypothetical protein